MPFRNPRRVAVESLLEADPDLATGLGPADRDALRRSLVVPVVTLPPASEPVPSERPFSDSNLGLLVLDGLLARDVKLAGIGCTELLGAGDLVRPSGSEEPLIPVSVKWSVFTDTRIAIIDERATRAIKQAPTLATRLLDRALRHSESQATHLAITCLTGVDLRVHMLLWHLADRWAKVTRDGVVLELPLTHEQLGRLVRSRRQSVSNALGELADRGLLTCPARGRYVLRGEPPAGLEAFDARDRVKAARTRADAGTRVAPP
jgi:CRP/FNR family cyclic AMP-dependent transcriptional regulator